MIIFMNFKYGEKVKARDGSYIDKEIFDPVIDAAEESIEKSEENARATVPNIMKLTIGVDTTYFILWLNCIDNTTPSLNQAVGQNTLP